ncbi:arf-GAP domain and FG repeat-containing protein 2-like, partial [Onychostruthus taczanowskii]|uniref:arf-GAP domain and FG repeat-containing protein 2-like n=1 Tax=Onychostruthus taczanowskii TaxID=356909 RepID=UPI001B80CCAE
MLTAVLNCLFDSLSQMLRPRGPQGQRGPGRGGAGPGGGPGARRGSAGRDAEAEVWCRRVRELVSAVPANRLCFECGQRGVTYVDISVGSLVCTGCSGALRGLNPPHRVKSISMTTFSEAEVLFLRARGNEACRRVWLGTFDPRASPPPDPRDPQKVKEFLREKYEKKRWYVAPEQGEARVKPPRSPAAEPGPPQLLPGDAATLAQVGVPGGTAPPDPAVPPQPPAPPAPKAGTDLLADIGGDPFARPAPAFAASPGEPGAPTVGRGRGRGARGSLGDPRVTPSPARSALPGFDAFGGSAAFGGAVPPSTTGTLRPPPGLSERVGGPCGGPGRGLGSSPLPQI